MKINIPFEIGDSIYCVYGDYRYCKFDYIFKPRELCLNKITTIIIDEMGTCISDGDVGYDATYFCYVNEIDDYETAIANFKNEIYFSSEEKAKEFLKYIDDKNKKIKNLRL